jgi:Zn-dependent M16 (insulinase) family peptidase
MPASLTPDQWMGLYRRLISRLRESELTEVVDEIESAASRPVIADPSVDEQAWVSSISKEVSQTAVRARTPEEAFAVAVKVLSARLVEVPSIAAAIRARLGESEIVFHDSEDSTYSESQRSAFSLSRMTVPSEDAAALRHAVEILAEAAVPGRSL